MCALRTCFFVSMLTVGGMAVAAVGTSSKSVDVPDADLRLMAMLYVSLTTPR